MRNGKIFRPTAVITFDDGFQNNYNVAFPILQKAKLPATIFLVTGLVNTNDTLWSYRLKLALAKTRRSSFEWDRRKFNLSGWKNKAKISAAIRARLKGFAQPQLLAEVRKIILELGDDPDSGIKVDSPYRMLSHEAITEMAASGLIEFGAHTHSHAILSLLSPREQYTEIERSVNTTSAMTGRPCELFAYPNGSEQDYDKATIKSLESCGVLAAVTTINGLNDEMTPVMELRRYGIGGDQSTGKFKRKVRLINEHFTAARGAEVCNTK